MTYQLFPQLPRRVAEPLAAAHGGMSPSELRVLASHHHADQVFSATGGQQVSSRELDEIAEKVRARCANASPSTVDPGLTRDLHPRMRITRHEAALDGVWSFLGCVLLPDIVRWRFESEVTPPDRFLGASRGVRNVLGRAWWRGELLFDAAPPQGRDEYWLAEELGEDELTGIIERQRAVGSRRVAVALAKALVTADCGELKRRDVARDAFKAYLRLGYFVEFDALADDELAIACQSLYRRSVRALKPKAPAPA